MIFDAYKNVKILAGNSLADGGTSSERIIPADIGGFRKFIVQHSDEPLRDIVRRWNPYLGKPLLNEVFVRAGLSAGYRQSSLH